MIYNYLLFFLGIYSWNFNSKNLFERVFLKKKLINLQPTKPLKNSKKLITLDKIDSNSPALSFYIDSISLTDVIKIKRYKVYLYNVYSLLIFLFLCLQPSYLIYKLIFSNDNKFQEYLITFLININTPVNYLWSKYYFTTNHFDLFINSCGYNCLSFTFIILLLTFLSIIVSFTNIDSFYNNFYYINELDKIPAIIIISIEWLYARLIFSLNLSAFTIVFCKHVKDIRKFINEFISNELDLEESYCLTPLISSVSNLRHSVEISIRFFNILLSFNTVAGGLALAIFFRHMYVLISENREFTLANHEYYLLQSFSLYIICQIIFFYNVINYSELRNKLVKLIQSPSFINKFLTRWSTSKLKKKCKDKDEIKHLNKMLICIEQENATSLDWIILEKLIQAKWMDFSILGISTQDGGLIKKVITFSSLIYLVLSYIN